MEGIPQDKKIILFDGVCNLCDSTVNYIIKRDKKDIFRFVPMQTDLGQRILKHLGISERNIDSIVFYEPGKAYYYKSHAALKVAKNLGGLYAYAIIFKCIPNLLRDYLYDFVARNRYKWYGKKESCMIPTSEIKAKFLE